MGPEVSPPPANWRITVLCRSSDVGRPKIFGDVLGHSRRTAQPWPRSPSTMADISSKKRKRGGESSAKPKKKVVLDVPVSTASVSSVLRPKHCPPVIGKELTCWLYSKSLLTCSSVATTPGVEISENVAFYPYQPREGSRSKSTKSKHAGDKELLLHSTSHRSLDYTAREEGKRGLNQLVNHYVGIYDPKTGNLEVVEAKKMVVRGMVRAKQAPASSMGEDLAKRVRSISLHEVHFSMGSQRC